MERYQKKEVRILPILVRHVDVTHDLFSGRELFRVGNKSVAAWGEDRDEAYAQIATKIRTIVYEILGRKHPSETSSQTPLAEQINPYRGLKPYTEQDAHFFFCRTTCIFSLLQKLVEERRLLIVLGPTGSGKTSILQVGVIPLLREGRTLPRSATWEILPFTPGEHPTSQLFLLLGAPDVQDVREGIKIWQQALARRILVDLVALGDESEGHPDTRRQRLLTNLCRTKDERKAAQAIVEKLAKAHLLEAQWSQQKKDLEVTLINESLLREWSPLKDWLREDRQFLLWYQEFERHLQQWLSSSAILNQRDTTYLLHRGMLLEANLWLKESLQRFLGEAQNFVLASSALREQEEHIEEEEFQGEMAAVELALKQLDAPEVDGVTYAEVIEAGEHLPGMAALWDVASVEERYEMVTIILEPGGLYYDLENKIIAAIKPRSAFLPVLRMLNGVMEFDETRGLLVTEHWCERNRRDSNPRSSA